MNTSTTMRTLTATAACATLLAAAWGCSSSIDNGGTGSDGGAGSSSGSQSSSGSNGSSSGASSSGTSSSGTTSSGSSSGGSSSSGSSSGTCATTSLIAGTAGQIYCGFQDAGSIYCPTGQECCLGGFLGGAEYDPNACSSFGAACTNGISVDAGGSPGVAIECNQVSDCTANGVSAAVACCLQGATAPADPAGCTYPKSSGGTAIVCETTACAAGEVPVCSSQTDCQAGKVCTAGRWKTFDLGFCL